MFAFIEFKKNQNWIINENARKKKLKSWSPRVFLVRYRRAYVLNNPNKLTGKKSMINESWSWLRSLRVFVSQLSNRSSFSSSIISTRFSLVSSLSSEVLQFYNILDLKHNFYSILLCSIVERNNLSFLILNQVSKI